MRMDKALLVCLAMMAGVSHGMVQDYKDALSKSFLFFEAQRSGILPPSQRVTWRANSGLSDGKTQGVDLVGGYYDAGDHVKFGLPMAFTVTMLSWSVIEYRKQLEGAGELGHALDAIKWGTDYFIKAHPQPNVLWGEVGDGDSDHYCWQRAEDMTTNRQAYKIDQYSPGSDLAAETAAAMAAASIAFKLSNPTYSSTLLSHATQLFEFADKFRGKYDDSIGVAKKFYVSASGYNDELLWGAMWLYLATEQDTYLNYVVNNAHSLGGSEYGATEFSWDTKYAGVQVLAAKILLSGKGGSCATTLALYKQKADQFVCACLQKNYGQNVLRTPGGMLYVRQWDNMQYVTASSFLVAVYSDYLTSAKQILNCPAGNVQPLELENFAKSQVNYLLGDNPKQTSYMVGYGKVYPQKVHHRGASITSIKKLPQLVGCQEGYSQWYEREQADPNVLVGALVGGPDMNDNFEDDRGNYEQTEPCTYNNAPLVGLLAKFTGLPALKPVNPPYHKSTPTAPNNNDNYAKTDIAIAHTIIASWSSGGRTYYKHRVTVINNSKKPMSHISFSITNLAGPIWGLSQTQKKGIYTFPVWMKALNPGAHFYFMYVQAGPQAKISVVGYN